MTGESERKLIEAIPFLIISYNALCDCEECAGVRVLLKGIRQQDEEDKRRGEAH